MTKDMKNYSEQASSSRSESILSWRRIKKKKIPRIGEKEKDTHQ